MGAFVGKKILVIGTHIAAAMELLAIQRLFMAVTVTVMLGSMDPSVQNPMDTQFYEMEIVI